MATVAECAEHLFLSERRFYEMLDQGVVDRAPASAYDIAAVREQYIEHLRSVAAGRGGGDGALDLTEERARLAKQQADAQAMKNEVTRGDLLPRSDVHAAVTSAFARVRAKLLSLPAKCAPLVIGVGSVAEVKERISDGVREALGELAATTIAGVPRSDGDRPASAGSGADVVANLGAAARPDGEPVGRPGKKAKSGGKRRARRVGHKSR